MKNPILVVTAVLVLAGCTDALAPNVALGVYPLRTLDGNGEPFVIQDTTLASGERLVLSIADTFDFQSSSRTQHTEYTQTVFYDPDGTKDSVFAYISYPGAYRIQRDTIFVTYLPDFAPPRSADTLVVQVDGTLDRRLWVTGWCFGGEPCPGHVIDLRYRRL